MTHHERQWTIGDGEVARLGHHECLLVIGAATEAEADAIIERAVAAGANLVTTPGHQPWGSPAPSQIPTATSGW